MYVLMFLFHLTLEDCGWCSDLLFIMPLCDVTNNVFC